MKKFIQFLIVFLVALTLSSCSKQEINKGLYIFPVIGLILAARKFNNVRKGYKQGESIQPTPEGMVTSNKKSIAIGELVYGIIFLLASIGMAYWVYEENRVYDPKRDKHYPEKPAPDGRESAGDQARKADSVYNLNK